MSDTSVFLDDFNDGIWTKYPGNPVLTRTDEWEARCICESSVISEHGILKMWYMGCRASSGYDASLGYATSKDGFTWEKHPGNPILTDPKEAIIRPTVMEHDGTYYLFASDYQWNDARGVISRWTSSDGLHWANKTAVLAPTEPWEGHFHNTGVIVDDNGTWQMIYSTDGPVAYAYSPDGLHWTKHDANPVISGFYGGDPCLKKIGDKYFIWHSRDHNGHLRIYCMWSTDMIHWRGVYNNPSFGYTEPWERGAGRPEAHWDRHLTDADLCEYKGRVLMYYQGAQNPFGVAIFDGTFEQLAERLLHQPPLSKWEESPFGCVENKELKLPDNETDDAPLVEKIAEFSDTEGYVFEFRARCYDGPSCQIKPVMRYVDGKNYARFWIMNNGTTWYQECRDGQLGGTASIGANNICDNEWHDWKIIVHGDTNTLYLDGRHIGQWASSPGFVNRQDLRIGLGVFDTYAAFDYVRVRKFDG